MESTTTTYHAMIPKGEHGQPQRTIDGTAFEIIEWATMHNLQFAPKFTADDKMFESGFAVFTVQRSDGKELTAEETDVFKARAQHRTAVPWRDFDDIEAHRNKQLGIAL